MIPPLRDEPTQTTTHVLPDVLEPSLTIVFCGTAAGKTSARVGAYYADPRNKFWATLYNVGLTPHQLKPEGFWTLPQYGLGLTDLAKYTSGSDVDLHSKDYAIEMFEAQILKYTPKLLCFSSKEAAKQYFGIRHVDYGELNKQIGDTRLFVAPSTSGSGNGYWDITYWHQLAALSQTL